MMTTPAKDRLHWYTKLAYGSTDLGFAFTDSAIAVVYMIFLTNVIGLALDAVFVITLIRMTWDYINDPIIGFITRMSIVSATTVLINLKPQTSNLKNSKRLESKS